MTVATNIILPKLIATRTCLDSIAVPKGTLMKLSGTLFNTVAAATGTGEPFGGITTEEKTANDGVVTIGCAMDGVWDIYNNALPTTITLGKMVVMSGANMIREAVAGDLLTGAIVGKTEETSAASAGVRVRLIGY